jgi:FkbM family methyltransferase
MAVEAARKGDVAEAERLCRLVLSSDDPNHYQAMEFLGEILMRTGRPAEAAPYLRQANLAYRGVLATTSIAHGLHVLKTFGWQPKGILDIGAYHGEWTMTVRQMFPDARFLMIEAQPEKEPLLRAVAARGPAKVDVRIALVGSKNRDAVDFFRIDEGGSSGSSTFEEQTTLPRTVLRLPMRRLDELLLPADGTFQLLKLDVQGAELDVIEGATGLLSGLDAIAVESAIVEYNKGAPLFSEFIAALDRLDFRLFDVFPRPRLANGVLTQVDAIFLKKDSPLWPKPPFF